MNAATPRSDGDGGVPPGPRRELLNVLVAKRPDLVRFFAARLDSRGAAEDLIEDLVLRIESLEIQTAVDDPSALIYRAAANLMLDRLRGERRSQRRDNRRAGVGDTDIAAQPSPEQTAEARERLRRLMAAIESLPPNTRRVLERHKFDGQSHVETARWLGMSRKTVEKQISAALRRISRKLGMRDDPS